MVVMGQPDIKYGNMRKEFLDHIENIVSLDKSFTLREHEPKVSKEMFEEVIHFVFDDTQLGKNPKNCIGIFLRDEYESIIVQNFVSLFDLLCNEYDENRPLKDIYIALNWKEMAASANTILSKLQ